MKIFKCKPSIIVLVIAILFTSGSAMAENPENITLSQCDDINRVVTVSGTITENYENEDIMLTVLKKNIAGDTFKNTDAGDIASVLSYFGQQPIESDGSFSFSFKLVEESGNYTVLISSRALEGKYETSLAFENTLWAELKALKDDVSDGALQRFRSFVENETSSLAVSVREYNDLSEEGKNSVCTALKSYSEDYDATSFALQWNKNNIWTFIDENRNDISSVSEMMRNQKESSFFSQEWLTFALDNLPDTVMTALYADILSNPECNSLDKFIQMAGDNIIITYVHNTVFWKDMYVIIDAGNNVFGFNPVTLADFNALDDKNSVVNLLHTQGQNLNTSAEIIGLFDTLVSAQKMAESTPAPTQTPRPSKGNGGSWSVGTPAVVPSVTPTPSVSPEPVKPAEPSKPEFNDIDSVEWAAEAIEYLSEKGIISGVGDGKFEPNRPMTREELIKMLDNAFGYSKEEAESNFADADRNAWYYNAISAAAQKGIINGYADNTFGIGKQITREDAAVIFFRVAGSEKLGSIAEPEFSDSAEISDYAKEAVGVMNKSGIISGMGNGMFMPKNSLTRAEAAKMFYGLLMCIGA